MIHKMFSIHDSKAEAFLPVFTLHQEAMAIRTFADCINSSEHQFAKHPGDYTLFLVGTFNDHTGEILTAEVIKSLGNGLVFVEKTSEPGQTDLFPVQTHNGSNNDHQGESA